MKAIKVGINGFGRIGRLVFRAAQSRSDIQIVGINDLMDVEYIAYMLKYDSIHGQFDGSIETKDGKLVVNGNTIRISAEKDPANLKWNEVEAEYIVESTGLFLTKEKAQAHIAAGAKYVIMSGPSKDDTPMFVPGVNDDKYVKGTQFISNASCTTNCLALVAKVLNDKFGIEEALMSTIHSTTATQKICKAMKEASEGSLKGYLAYTADEVVSSDMIGNPNTAIFDEKAGIMLNPTFVKVVAWYDNEWGFSCKVLDSIAAMKKVNG